MPRKDPPVHSRFKKGTSGNPKGRPPKMPELDTILNKLLGEENSKGLSQMELIISRLRSKAKAGNLKAAEILLERAYGKAKQPISIEDSEVKIVVTAKQPPKK